MKRTIVSTIFILFVAMTAYVSPASAVDACPAINCDCDVLPKASWLYVCRKHEERIKKACIDNSNTPKDYCLIHGLDASPLPLALELADPGSDIDPSEVSEMDKALQSILWSIYADIEQVQRSKSKKAYAKALQVLKLIDSNMDSAFEQQQIIASSKAEIALFGSRASWKKYSSTIAEAAKKLETLGDELAVSAKNTKAKKESKIFSVLTQKSYRMSGKAYEQSGYGYGEIGLDSQAAQSWQSASNQSLKLAHLNKRIGGKVSGRKFSEFQTAARLHRASYHWLMSDEIIDSERVLFESRQYLGREEQESLGRLLQRLDGENTREGELTER